MKKTLLATLIVASSAFAAAQDAAPATPATPATTPLNTPLNATQGSEAAIQGLAAQNLSPEDRFAQAQELAAQAEIAYPVPFYDRILYKAATEAAVLAARAQPDNRQYTAYAGELFTKTQWWINGYNIWNTLTDLTDQEKQWAALTATKLAYLALERGDKESARAYIAKGQGWADSPALQALARRAA